MSDKVNAKLYRIEELRVTDRQNSYKLIKEIVEDYNNKSGHEFREIKIKEAINNGDYKLRLYIYNTPVKSPTWLNFIKTLSTANSDFDDLENKYCSFVLFVYSDDNIFAITKGYYGHHLLAEYIDNFFGLEVLSRLIDKTSTEIKQITERGIFGIEVGSQRFFRENYNLSLDDDFGKIYKGLLASIEEEDFAKLGVLKKRDSTKKVSIVGSTSLDISTNFNYRELLGRIGKISDLLKLDGVEFNQFYRLSQVQLSKIKDDLNNKILELAYKKYKNGESIDFYHPNINNYLHSTSTQFRKDDVIKEVNLSSSLNYVALVNLLKKDILDVSNKTKFIETFKESFGSYSLSEDYSYINEVSLDKWLNGEIEYKGKKYFKIDNAWYLYRESFDDYLNEFLKINNFPKSPTTSLKDWTNKFKDEGEYNLSFKNEDGFIVADKALVSNIEIADLIKVDNNVTYLYHIKKGMGQDMRVLSNQIINSARFLTNLKNESEHKTLKKYYKHISNKHYDKKTVTLKDKGVTTNFSEDEFLKLFQGKVVLVFVYASSSIKDIKDEIIATNSRIAKLSLLYTIRDLKRTDYDFYIERIVYKP